MVERRRSGSWSPLLVAAGTTAVLVAAWRLYGMDWRVLIAAMSAAAGGTINAAGAGGAIVTYVGLTLGCGLSPMAAVASSQITTPFAFAAARHGRGPSNRTPMLWTLGPLTAGAGGLLGALILPHIPSGFSGLVAPWLVMFASVLLLAHPLVRRVRAGPWPNLLHPVALICGLYGGVWGLSVGSLILMAVLMTRPVDGLGMANRTKVDWCLTVSVGAAIGYLSTAVTAPTLVAWPLIPWLILGAGAGGFAGERWVRLLPEPVHWGIVISTSIGGVVCGLVLA